MLQDPQNLPRVLMNSLDCHGLMEILIVRIRLAWLLRSNSQPHGRWTRALPPSRGLPSQFFSQLGKRSSPSRQRTTCSSRGAALIPIQEHNSADVACCETDFDSRVHAPKIAVGLAEAGCVLPELLMIGLFPGPSSSRTRTLLQSSVSRIHLAAHSHL